MTTKKYGKVTPPNSFRRRTTCVVGAVWVVVIGCSGPEREFGSIGVVDGGDAGGVTTPDGTCVTIGDASVGCTADRGSLETTNAGAGRSGESSAPNGNGTAPGDETAPDDSTAPGDETAPDDETAPGDETAPANTASSDAGSHTTDGTQYVEDPGYAESCVVACQNTFYGDVSPPTSISSRLRLVVPTAQCSKACATEVVEISAGSAHTCARRGDGLVKCWGSGDSGRLGLGDTDDRGDGPNEMGDALPAVDLGHHVARAITAGHKHTCVLLDDWSVSCWGDNAYGQLGLGDAENRADGPNETGDLLAHVDLGSGQLARAVSAGHYHTCAVLDSGEVKCWGQNTFSQLGRSTEGSVGDESGEMGDDLPAVNLGTDMRALQVTATYEHTCARLQDDSLKCWGNAAFGRLGREGSDVIGDEPREMGDALSPVDLGTRRYALSFGLGYLHSCAVLGGDDAVKCWGYGANGRLGTGDGNPRNLGDEPDEMGDALPVINLGAGAKVRLVAPGDEHTCALLTNGAVKCWGAGTFGRLGSEEQGELGNHAREMGDNLAPVALGTGRIARALTSGQLHTCALLDDGAVKCWGQGDHGRLGLGNPDHHGDDAGEMGDNLRSVAVW